MAEKDASLAIENAVEQLEHASALVRETHKLRSLKTGLGTMSTLVKELNDQDYEQDVAEWLQKVRKIAYDTQDVIGSVVADTHLLKQRSKLGRLLSGKRLTKHQEEIEDIEERIEKICSFKSVAGSNESYRGQSFSKINEVEGFQDAQETLVRQLIDDARSQREVILIFGKPGSGKTTLAKMVYNCGHVREHFDCQVWDSFPQELPLENMLRRILKQTGSSSNQTDGLYKDELKVELSKSFEGKRYLIVIDNVHNSDALNELISSFPDELNRSRILLASRMNEADLQLQQRLLFSYEVKPLDENQSWDLLSRKVFEGENYSNLENLGKRMAGKCKGSPGAIMALAAILNSAEKTEHVWSNILEGHDVLLQFNDLAKELKLCLLYFGLFSDHNIPAKQMIQMWMAERLLKQRGSTRAEEIGEQYLNNLISRSFIQVTRRPDETVKTCHTCNHVSRFCKSEGAKWNFFEVHSNNSSKPQNEIHRMAIHSDSITDVLKSFGNCSHVHSLHCIGKITNSTSTHSEDFWKILHHEFPKLKVLNLGFLELNKIPKKLGKLKNLRYLRVRAPNVKHLPSSIVNLHQLETLDMRESCFTSLPHGLWKMQLLRHLYLGGSTSLPNTNRINYYKSLPNLQTLSGVRPDKNLKRLMIRAKFPNVTKLKLCSSYQLTTNCLNSLDHLRHLQSLRLENPTELPELDAFPLNLTKLTLFKTKLKQDCIKTLGELPNLRILKLLREAIREKEIEIRGFLQLECLYIEDLDVETWKLEDGAMQGIKHFFVKGCEKTLQTAPEYLRKKASNSESEVDDGAR